ncbi:MAG: phosphatase PAP2 family protein [Patescibacteria group bacterium]
MGFEALMVQNIQHYFLQSTLDVGIAVFLARWLILGNVFLAAFLALSGQPKKIHAIGEAVWSLIVALTLTSLIALVVHRARPYLGDAGIELLIPQPLNSSFPSGHTASAISVALPFLLASRGVGLTALVIAVLVMLGRMAVGVHYPTDLLGGIVIGAVSFALVRVAHRELRTRDIIKTVRAWRKAAR